MHRFGQIVARVMESLPGYLRPYLENVVVDVEEEADVEMLLSVGLTEEEIEAGESIYGVFQPIDLPSQWGGDAIAYHDMPHRIVIYKRPLEEDFLNRRELMLEIRRTVIHEVSHHFGITDRDIDRDPSLEDGSWLAEDDAR